MSVTPETLVGQTAEELQRAVGFALDSNYLDRLARDVVRGGLTWSQALSRIYRDHGTRYQVSHSLAAPRQRARHASLYDPYGRVEEFTWYEEPNERLFRFLDGTFVTYDALDHHNLDDCRTFTCHVCMVARDLLNQGLPRSAAPPAWGRSAIEELQHQHELNQARLEALREQYELNALDAGTSVRYPRFIPREAPYMITVETHLFAYEYRDYGVVSHPAGTTFVKVPAGPLRGQYAQTGSTYIFHSYNAGEGVVISGMSTERSPLLGPPELTPFEDMRRVQAEMMSALAIPADRLGVGNRTATATQQAVQEAALEISRNAGRQVRQILQMSGMGALSANEARRLLGLDPAESPVADTLKPVTKEPDPPVLVFGVRKIVLE
jgi:hypothetical protein